MSLTFETNFCEHARLIFITYLGNCTQSQKDNQDSGHHWPRTVHQAVQQENFLFLIPSTFCTKDLRP